MTATQSNPLGVHTLSEFVFCPRAGVISHYQQKPDNGTDEFVDLSYSPDYDVELAKIEVGNCVRKLELFSCGVLGGSLAVLVAFAIKPFLGFLCCLIFVPSVLWLLPEAWNLVKDYLRYRDVLEKYRLASQRKPDLNNPDLEEIPWFDLLKSFDAEKCKEPFSNEQLIGSPWKMLIRGEICMPVFFCRRPSKAKEDESPMNWLRQQHYIRMRAYCDLIEQSTNYRSICGIVLFAGSQNAVAMKFWESQESDASLQESLFLAGNTIQEFDQKNDINAPSPALCSNCHYGCPRIYNLGNATKSRTGQNVRPKLTQHEKSNRSYHSVCGDFFQWLPPHEKVVDLESNT